MPSSFNHAYALGPAYARVIRAQHHIAELEREIAGLGQDTNLVVAPTGTGTFLDTTGDVPDILSILIGETIYNLRAALDYLIYELAYLDSGEIQERTQFPITHKSTAWKQALRGQLAGLAVRHQTAIEALQPLTGCTWTGVLQEISNPDKHMKLTLSVPGIVVRRFDAGTDQSIDPSSWILFIGGDLITDRRHAVDALHELSSNVEATLDQFKACFDGQCGHA
jgi:hypothetical protein